MLKIFFPLLVFFLMFRCSLAAHEGIGDDMVEAANNLLASLSSDQRGEINFEVNDTSREIWHFLPVASFDRFGLPLTSLDDAQDQLVYDLIAASLSDEGFEKAEQIMGLEIILKAMENNAPRRDPQQYHIAIYGTPSVEGIWSWGFSGHHISLHFTMVDGELASTPTFLGSNPAEVREGASKGLRVLKDEEDKALALLNALTPEQVDMAIFLEEAPYEIFTAANSVAMPQENLGITYLELEPAQQAMLKDLVQEYLDVMPAEIKTARKEKIEASGWDQTYFAWAGKPDRSGGHYYRVQGPTFLIEFDNTQNEANHVHTVWRDFKGDFGRDLIMEHYKASH